ncbi:hypothetical protein [Enterococcus sp. DIV0800]|uniref:hypothetical protein n=1 Tax=unclassified Enterococcus TaxID=2608891 RepID=UPI003D2FC685
MAKQVYFKGLLYGTSSAFIVLANYFIYPSKEIYLLSNIIVLVFFNLGISFLENNMIKVSSQIRLDLLASKKSCIELSKELQISIDELHALLQKRHSFTSKKLKCIRGKLETLNKD